MDYEEYQRKALEPIVNYIESVMASYSKEEIEARIKKALPEKESEDERIRKEIRNFLIDMECKKDWVAYLEKQKEQKPAEWSERHIADVFEKVGLAKIVREQGNDELTNALQDAMLELSKSGNAEWGEEDERLLTKLMAFVDIESFDRECNGQDVIGWLKSLRPQPHWKPSEEQIDALNSIILNGSFTYVGQAQDLISLKDKLEKL